MNEMPPPTVAGIRTSKTEHQNKAPEQTLLSPTPKNKQNTNRKKRQKNKTECKSIFAHRRNLLCLHYQKSYMMVMPPWRTDIPSPALDLHRSKRGLD